MKKILPCLILMGTFFTSCSVFQSLHSTTYIAPQQQFALGNNKHGSFRVQLTNQSSNPVYLHLAPVDGGSYSPQTVAPNETVKVKVYKNTAIIIRNKSTIDTAAVALKVTGDLGLSMGYQP